MLYVRTALVEAALPLKRSSESSLQDPFTCSAIQLETQLQTRAKSEKRNSCSQMWTETGGQRETCSLPVPRLPPCSRDKTCWCPVAHKPGDQTQSYRGVKKILSHQISHQCSLWHMAPTPNSPDRSLRPQSFPVPATVWGRSGGLALVPPLHCQTQSWQQEPC